MAEQKALVKAANGMMVSIPVSRLGEWKKRQDEIAADLKAGRTPQPTEEERQQKERLTAKMRALRDEAQREKESGTEAAKQKTYSSAGETAGRETGSSGMTRN